MIFSRRRGPAATAVSEERSYRELLEEADSLSAGGEHDLTTAERVLDLRHRAGLELLEAAEPGDAEYPGPAFDRLGDTDAVPEIEADALTPEVLRAAMLRNGCLLVRGLLDSREAASLARSVDQAYAAREAHAAGEESDPAYFREFEADARFALAAERAVVRASGAGLLAVDSPRPALEVLAAFERRGVRRLAAEYLGEPTAISVNKSLLRRVEPRLYDETADAHGLADAKRVSGWHQDGAFLRDVRALNVWLALSRCGDVAPGMDVVPRRLDHIVPTGTDGALFDWSVAQSIAEQAAGDAGIVRPVFEAGDALLFDELFLHATAAEPGMPNVRYAVESWFFGASGFPSRYAPLAF